MVFPAQVIYTQTFYSNQEEMDLSIFLFQFFAIQVVFYGASSILSGLLNAKRNYLPGAIAPVFNNIIVIVTFLAYAFIAPANQTLAFYIIAMGQPARRVRPNGHSDPRVAPLRHQAATAHRFTRPRPA